MDSHSRAYQKRNVVRRWTNWNPDDRLHTSDPNPDDPTKE